MHPLNGLPLRRRIPPGVHQDHPAGTNKIEPLPPRPERHQQHLLALPKLHQTRISLPLGKTSIQSRVGNSLHLHGDFQQVQHGGPLREDHSRFLVLAQQLHQPIDFGTAPPVCLDIEAELGVPRDRFQVGVGQLGLAQGTVVVFVDLHHGAGPAQHVCAFGDDRVLAGLQTDRAVQFHASFELGLQGVDVGTVALARVFLHEARQGLRTQNVPSGRHQVRVVAELPQTQKQLKNARDVRPDLALAQQQRVLRPGVVEQSGVVLLV